MVPPFGVVNERHEAGKPRFIHCENPPNPVPRATGSAEAPRIRTTSWKQIHHMCNIT